jgi:hypothetical protein
VTSDVDLNALTGFGGEDLVIDTMLAHYRARIPDAKAFAISRRVLLLSSTKGTGIDVSLGALPFEEKVIERSSPFDFDGIELRTCSAEDLIVMKLFASRPGDFRRRGRCDSQSRPLGLEIYRGPAPASRRT